MQADQLREHPAHKREQELVGFSSIANVGRDALRQSHSERLTVWAASWQGLIELPCWHVKLSRSASTAVALTSKVVDESTALSGYAECPLSDDCSCVQLTALPAAFCTAAWLCAQLLSQSAVSCLMGLCSLCRALLGQVCWERAASLVVTAAVCFQGAQQFTTPEPPLVEVPVLPCCHTVQCC